MFRFTVCAFYSLGLVSKGHHFLYRLGSLWYTPCILRASCSSVFFVLILLLFAVAYPKKKKKQFGYLGDIFLVGVLFLSGKCGSVSSLESMHLKFPCLLMICFIIFCILAEWDNLKDYGISAGMCSPILFLIYFNYLVGKSFHNENAKRPNIFKEVQFLFIVF